MKRKRIILPILAAFVLLAASVLFSTTKSSAQKLDAVVIECDRKPGRCWALKPEGGNFVVGYIYRCKWTGKGRDFCSGTDETIANALTFMQY